MQEKLGKSVLRSHWPQLPDPLPHTPCPLPSVVYPPRTWVPDTAVLMKPHIQATWWESPGLLLWFWWDLPPPPPPSAEAQTVFFSICPAILLGSLPHSPGKPSLVGDKLHTLTQGHHQPQHPSQTWEAPSASHSSHQQILSCTATLGDLDTELWSLTVASQLKPRSSLSHY